MERSSPSPPPEPPPEDPGPFDPAHDEPIFRAILWVLILSVVAGVGLALTGDLVFGSETMKTTGTGIGVISGLIYFVFRWLGKREAKRRRTRER